MLTSHAELNLKSCCCKSEKHRTFDGNATRKCISIPGTQKSTAIPVCRALFDDMVFGALRRLNVFWPGFGRDNFSDSELVIAACRRNLAFGTSGEVGI